MQSRQLQSLIKTIKDVRRTNLDSQLDEGISGSAEDIISAAISSHDKLNRYFDDLMEETKAAMQKALSINIADYLEDHINDKSDIRIVLQFIANNPEHVEKVIKKHLQLDVIDMGKIVKAIGPDIAKDMIDEIVSDAKFAKFVDDAKNLGKKAKSWIKGLFS